MKKILFIIAAFVISFTSFSQGKKHHHKGKKKIHHVHKKRHVKSDTATTGMTTMQSGTIAKEATDVEQVDPKDRGPNEGSATGRRMKSLHRHDHTKSNNVIQTPNGPIKTGGYKPVRGADAPPKTSKKKQVVTTGKSEETPPIYIPKKKETAKQ